jgi:NarL family two-component system response regulator LiaR
MDLVRIVIVDDHPIVRQGLRAVIRVIPGLELVGEACDGQEALEVVGALRPDLVLMDLVMPGMDGVAAIAALKQAQPAVRVMALTTFAEAELVLGAVQAGVDGYLLKDVDVQELARAVQTVSGGQPYLHPEATRHLLRATVRPDPDPERLTRREQQVLALVARGLTNRAIARELGIAEKTASVHVSNLLAKLSLASRTQAALYAAQTGLLPLDQLAADGS